MRYIKFIVLIASIVLAAGANAEVYTDTVNGIEWNYTVADGKASIGGGDDLPFATSEELVGQIEIPETLGGYPVTEIGAYSFQNCSNLTSVVIPTSVTYVRSSAFQDCSNITSVVFKNAETLVDPYGKTPFAGCTRIRNVTLSSGPFTNGSVYRYWFPDSYQMITNVVFIDGVKIVGEGALENFYSLENIHLPETVESIGARAFHNCGTLRSLTVPDSIISIGDSAFNGCGRLEEITLPFVGNSRGCSDDNTLSEENNSLLGFVFGTDLYDAYSCFMSSPVDAFGNPVEWVNVEVLGDVAMSNFLSGVTVRQRFSESIGYSSYTVDYVLPRNLKKVTITDDTALGYGAFYNCHMIESLTINGSVTKIGEKAFYGCSGLKEINMPNCVYKRKLSDVFEASYNNITNIIMDYGSVTYIGKDCFEGLIGLKSLTLPASVTRVCDGAFKDCALLESVTFEGDAPETGENIFSGAPLRLVTYVNNDSIGWSDDDSSALSSKWSGRAIVHSGSTGVGPVGGGDSSSGSSASVNLTVTNVVVHYVMNSVVPDWVEPPPNATGIVNVIAEVASGKPVAVSSDWATNFTGFVEKFGDDFASALTRPTGKRDAAGNAMLVWQDYVAGTDPTDETDIFTASITFDSEGKPVISYTPELSEEQAARRSYKKYGKVKLTDSDWTLIDGNEDEFNFFKVTVEMK